MVSGGRLKSNLKQSWSGKIWHLSFKGDLLCNHIWNDSMWGQIFLTLLHLYLSNLDSIQKWLISIQVMRSIIWKLLLFTYILSPLEYWLTTDKNWFELLSTMFKKPPGRSSQMYQALWGNLFHCTIIWAMPSQTHELVQG